MTDRLETAAPPEASPRPDWEQALDSLERSLREASVAVALLRRSLGVEAASAPATEPASAPATEPILASVAPAPRPAPAAEPIEADSGRPQPLYSQAELVPPPKDAPGLSAFDRLWDRIEQEKIGKQAEPVAAEQSESESKRGLPQFYLMTVEDREGTVDLVPLHRSLAGLRGIDEVSLVSYANGVPVISLRTAAEIDLDELGDVVSTAMDRQCEVIPQDRGRLYLRLKAS